MRDLRASATLLVVLTLAACMQVRSTFEQVGSLPPAPLVEASALDEMAAAFEGGYSREQIQSRLDSSFARFGLEPIAANYRHAADVLITLSSIAMESGCSACTEMAIVELIDGHTIGADWDSAARIAVETLGFPPLPSGAIPQ